MKLKLFLLSSVFFLLSFSAVSQTWEKTYPYSLGYTMLAATDYEYDAANGGFIVGWGEYSLSHTYYHAWLLRINTNGDTLWTQHWDSTDIAFVSTATARLSTGNYLVGGTYWDTSSWAMNLSYKEITPAGAVVSTTTFPLHVNEYGPDIDAGFHNDYFLTYHNDSAVPPSSMSTFYQTFIERRNNSGVILWSKNYFGLDHSPNPTYITPTPDGGFACSVRYDSISSVHSQIEKVDASGNTSWSLDVFGLLGIPSNLMGGSASIISTADSNLVFSYECHDSINSSIRSYLVKVDASGNLVDSISFLNTVLLRGTETSNHRFLYSYYDYISGVTTVSGFMFLDNDLHYMSVHPSPLSENTSNVKLVANNSGGAFLCFDSYAPISSHLFACNFDSLFNTYPVGIKGGVYLDNNTNCTSDIPDFAISNSMVTFADTSGTNYYAYGEGGTYSVNVPYGDYSVTHTSQTNKILECPLSGYNYSVGSDTTILNTNFFDTLVPGLNDLAVDLFPAAFVPGFISDLQVYYYNPGTVTANTTLKFIKDDSVQFISSVPPPNSIVGDTLFYTIGPLYYDSIGIIDIQLKTDSTTPIGTALKFIASFPLAGDLTPLNNIDTLDRIVAGAFDPNEKEVNQPHFFNGTDEMIYKVQFQNTGTLAAKNVIVIDTLDADLNISTFKLLNASHPVDVLFGSNNRATFSFKNINLPDSTSNEAGSHGNFVYSIKPKTGLAVGTEIKNTAYIYFDYNSPIVTNTTLNIVAGAFVGIAESSKKESQMSIFPNPANNYLMLTAPKECKSFNMECMDVTGRILLSESFANQGAQKIDISYLVSGIYFIRVTTGEYHDSKKLIIAR